MNSIFPYLIPVAFLAWVHGLMWAFSAAAIAALVAMPGDYMASHDKVDLLYAGFSTYVKLSGAAVGLVIARHLSQRTGHY